MPPIQADGALYANDYDGELSEEQAANSFLTQPEEGDDASRKKKPSENGTEDPEGDEPSTEEHTDDTSTNDEDPSDQSPDEDGKGEGDEDPNVDEKKFADSDDIFVKVKVGDEEHEVPVKDLKRLFGQEAALTRRSQEVADDRKTVDADRAKNIAALDVMIKRAASRADQFRNVQWAALMKDPNVTADELTTLQTAAKEAFEEESFLKTELDGFMKQVEATQQTERVKAAQECVKALSTETSPTYIKGWSPKVYDDIRSFGVEMGVHQDVVNTITDPAAFKIMHMAMQFKRGATKVTTTKVNKSPKKIVKTSTAPSASNSSAKNVAGRTQAVQKLAKSGSQQDAEAAFLASFADA